jgi:hypothetical protein
VWRTRRRVQRESVFATVNGFATLEVVAGEANLRVSTLRPACGPTAMRYYLSLVEGLGFVAPMKLVQYAVNDWGENQTCADNEHEARVKRIQPGKCLTA